MLLADARIELEPRPAAVRRPVLPAAMLGHCPGSARWERLADDRALLDEIAALGFEHATRRLTRLLAGGGRSQPGDDDVRALLRLPLPIYSLGQFQALFPDAFDAATGYWSRLAGDRAWLPPAVQDFFQNAAELPSGTLKLWLIRVPEDAGRRGMLPDPQRHRTLLDPTALGAFERALLIPEIGLIALPDLERLQVPAQLADIPPLEPTPRSPVFLPCSDAAASAEHAAGGRNTNDGEDAAGVPEPEPALAAHQVLVPILHALARHRPDLQCLLTLPLDADADKEVPQPDSNTLAYVARLAGTGAAGLQMGAARGAGSALARAEHPAPALSRIQLLFPYLRGPDRPLASPVGLIAGLQAQVSAELGTWRSIAGRPLPGTARPYPEQTQQQATALRAQPGVGVLVRHRGAVMLDDERLAAPVPSARAFIARGSAARDAEHYRSGEVARFLGWLRRELTRVGEALLFDVDPADPRPGIALTGLFTQLHQAGALRGRLPEQAFRVQQRAAPASVLAFDIEIAPSFPIDRIRLTFAQNRHAEGGSVEIADA